MGSFQRPLYGEYGERHDVGSNSHKYWAIAAFPDKLVVWNGRLHETDISGMQARARELWRMPLRGAKRDIPLSSWEVSTPGEEAKRRSFNKRLKGYVMLGYFGDEAVPENVPEPKPAPKPAAKTQASPRKENAPDRPERFKVWW